MLPYSGHLGVDRLIPYARRLCCDEDDEDKVRDAVEAMIGGDPSFLYEPHMTTPVSPEVIDLKPGEACFNIEKYPDAVRALLENGIITDTGYRKKFPICRVHAPQTDDPNKVQEKFNDRKEMLAQMGFQNTML